MVTMTCPRCWGSQKEPKRQAKCGYCSGNGYVEDIKLSEHFSLSEMTRSETATRKKIPNEPDPEQLENLKRTAQALEKVREIVGCGWRVNSALRQPDVNVAIGGSKTSVHKDGLAADGVPLEGSLKKAMTVLVAAMDAGTLELDQLIYEGTWIHIGIQSPKGVVRKQKLMMFGGKYFPLDLNDPRVS